MARDLTVAGAQNPSSLLTALGEALGAAGVNIEGISADAAAGHVHVLVEDVAAARRALGSAGLTVAAERQVILRSLLQRNVPGTWGRLARRLADFGVVIEFCYLATDTRIVVGVDDYDRAIAAMQIYGG